MGSMSLLVSRSLRLFLGVAGLISAAVALPVCAQTTQSNVETYVNQAVPNEEGVLPEGVEWNKPLKAGSLVLPRTSKAKAKTAPTPQAPSLPVGEMKAPQIGKSQETPALAKSSTGSSANVMLMQGMKNALQQAGENLNVPASDEDAGEASSAPSSAPSSGLQPPKLKGAADSTETAVKYESGRGPRNLATGEAVPAAAVAPKVDEKMAGKEESTLSSISSFFGMDASGAEAPKATEMQEAPVPLEQAPTKPAAQEKTSVFGPPVATAKETSGKCESKVTSWTRACKDAGYPAAYTGKITGETRVECPSGDAQDVWLSNTCAPPLGKTAAAEPKAAEPKAFAESKMEDGRMGPPPETASVAEALSAYSSPPPSSSSAPAAVPSSSALSSARVDANCGAASGAASNGRPAADLCSTGIATEISGDGPWRWSCKGLNGGMTVSCAAPVAAKATAKTVEKSAGAASKGAAPEDGKCGLADGTGSDTGPSSDLCARGVASRVNGGGPWTWACSGTNGGQAAACVAPKKVDGACGPAETSGADSRPDHGLCSSGYASAVTGEGVWNWTCSGMHGGSAATCSAAAKVNAVCGTASLTGHNKTPDEDLCKVGEASKVEGEGPWSWTCSGTQGGASVSCKAPTMVEGACGGANGKTFASAPSGDLCAQGKASRVTGSGPWNWNCSGLDGGSTVSCTASPGAEEAVVAGGKVACGAAAEAAAFQAPTRALCSGGKASAVSGTGPWNWSCSDNDGHNVACSTLASTEGACGTAANVPTSGMPDSHLCASGTPASVKADKSGKHWSWQCKGSMGAATVSCSAPVAKSATLAEAEDAKCGLAGAQGTSNAPRSGLCEEGKPSAVRGGGPWMWSCVAKSGRKVNCEAPKIAEGVCGAANGSIQKAVPLTGLCASGTPTEVDGSGPWLWSCVGSGGGGSVSCSAAAQAQARVDGSCGAAANASMTRMPDANLCDSGVPSSVYGEGPWTWTCSGLNGGIASPCSTSKIMPKAPPPPAQSVDGNCGPANGVAGYHQPMEGLCSSGTPTSVSGDGPWNWNCLAVNGGMTVSCTSPLMPPAPIEGVCGAANGVTTLTAPKSALCSAGISSAVSGKGPWTWSCSGTNGGGAVSCVAPLAGKSGPLPSTVTPSSPVYSPSPVRGSDPDEAPAPKAAPAGLVTPRLPTGSLPPLETGTLPDMKASKPLNLPPEASTLPQGAPPLMPPPVQDTVKPSPSLKPPEIDAEGKAIPGARLTLDADVSSLSFKRGSDQLDQDTARALDKLAGILQRHGNVRITLNAYAGTYGDSSPREARRLSLARALTVRDYLTGKGLSSGRIDVRALGANVPSGDMDRVDVKVN